MFTEIDKRGESEHPLVKEEKKRYLLQPTENIKRKDNGRKREK